MVSALWIILMLMVYGDRTPSFDQIRLVFSTTDPPLSAFLEDPDGLCQLIPLENATAIKPPYDPIPNYDFFTIPVDQLPAVSDALIEDRRRHSARRSEDPPEGMIRICRQRDYQAAAEARSEATKDRREAANAIQGLHRFVSLPLVLLVAGIFFFWSPFQRDD